MSSSVPASLARRVRDRADDRCEYCRISQSGQEATFHIDHITPRRAGGATMLDNLALACVSCSLRKGARSHAPDPEHGDEVRLFHPRQDRWGEHFGIGQDFRLLGLSAVGRATINLLQMNRPIAIAIRCEEAAQGRFP